MRGFNGQRVIVEDCGYLIPGPGVLRTRFILWPRGLAGRLTLRSPVRDY